MSQKDSKYIAEICCGSYYDALQAFKGGAERIELNSALALGGLTPTTATLRLVKENLPALKVIAMARPRGAGFCYTEEEFQEMEAAARELLEAGADGIAFGCLNANASLDMEKNKRMVSIIKEWGREAVFHRAFDCVENPFVTAEQLIELGIDRVLTSGLKSKAVEGAETIKKLQESYGDRIQILAGSGVNAGNVRELIRQTKVTQVHSSCKAWREDFTTVGKEVSYSMFEGEQALMYDVVSAELVRELVGLLATENPLSHGMN